MAANCATGLRGVAVSAQIPRCRGTANRVAQCRPMCSMHPSASGSNAQEPDRPVFESMPPCGEVSLFEARDAIEACEGLAGVEADACFLVFGLDCGQTRRWYPTVASLESTLALPDEEPDDDDTHDSKVDPWGLPQPLNEIFALWSDTADELRRLHDSSAHQ